MRAKLLQSCLTLCDSVDWPARLFCPWDSPGKNTGVGCHPLLQGIFLTQGSNRHLLHLLSVVDCPDLTKEPFTFPIKGKQSLQLAFPFQTKSFPETKIIFKDYLKLSPDKGYCPNF